MPGNGVQPMMEPRWLLSVPASVSKRLLALSLIGLDVSLPVAPVLEKKEGAAKDAAGMTGGLYKHGVELRLEGGYAELADYLARLEKLPQKLLWSNASLSADKHPKLVLTLTVFTLSLDRAWLAF